MKKYIIIVVIVSAFVMIFAAATNPSYGDYKEWYKQQTQDGFVEYKEGKETTEFEKSVMNFMADMITDTSVVREDYKLFSLYTMEEYKVLGLFNNFYILADEKSQE